MSARESIRSLEDEGLIYSTIEMSFTTKQPDEVHGIGNATRVSLAAPFVMNAIADSSVPSL